jgi:hypothetical protein
MRMVKRNSPNSYLSMKMIRINSQTTSMMYSTSLLLSIMSKKAHSNMNSRTK